MEQKMHIITNKSLYPFDECGFCKSCIPDAASSSHTPTGCDRCAMGSTPDRFKPNFKTDRENDLEHALKVLCQLKQYKDKNGKTELYNAAQPEAWNCANKLINTDD